MLENREFNLVKDFSGMCRKRTPRRCVKTGSQMMNDLPGETLNLGGTGRSLWYSIASKRAYRTYLEDGVFAV